MKNHRPRLAVYGGAFNPPTRGHVAAASMLLENGFERVLVMPCFGHTFGKSLAPAKDRLLMAHQCFQHLPNVRVSSFEIDLGLNGSTFELVTRLPSLAEYSTHDIFLAIGSDEANQIHRWRRSEELRQLIPFVVIPRVGHALSAEGAWAHHSPHQVMCTSVLMRETSSTQVKQALLADDHETLKAMLMPEVLTHITASRLYAAAAQPASIPS